MQARAPVAGSYRTEPRGPTQAGGASARALTGLGAAAAGTTLEWPSGSRGRWVRRLPCHRLSDGAGLWSPPTGVGGLPPRPSRRGHGSPARLVQLLKHHTWRALTPEVVGFPATPPFGWLGSPRPSALWDLFDHGYFRTAAGRRDSPGLFVGGLGRPPAAPAVAGGGTGAALLGSMNPRRGLNFEFDGYIVYECQ